MRIEMEVRYKAEQVWLTTNDKVKLHGYWVPCFNAREDEQMLEGDPGSSEGLYEVRPKENNYPTMIFCNPNAGFAEYF